MNRVPKSSLLPRCRVSADAPIQIEIVWAWPAEDTPALSRKESEMILLWWFHFFFQIAAEGGEF